MRYLRELFIVGIILFSSAVVFGQETKEVTGTVASEEDNEPLPGVNITIEGSTSGTQTDFDGNYTLEANGDANLVFSFVGYKDLKVSVNGRETIDVTMEKGESLDEVVVIGYGREEKRDIVGSVSQIESSEVEDMPVNNMARKLQGKIPGLQINQTSGEPGGQMSMQIRGANSINSGNQPLVVIDGYPSEQGLDDLNPNDIESVSVLKDAASSALYGSRAANGVIMVTTKEGKKGKTEVNFRSYLAMEKVPNRGRPDLMNAPEFAQFKKEFYEDQAKYENYTGGVPERYQNPDEYDPDDGTDWYDLLLRTGFTQNYNLSLSSGTEKAKTYTSINYSNEKGTILNSFSRKITARSNNTFKPTEDLTLGLKLSGTFKKRQVQDNLGGGRNIIALAYLMDPTQSYRNPDGSLPVSFESPGMFANPNWYRVLTERESPDKNTRLTGNAFAEYDILDGLTYKFSIDAHRDHGIQRRFIPSTAQGDMGSAPPQRATGDYNTNMSFNWMVENTLTYDRTFGDKHDISLLAGYSSQDFESENSAIDATDFPDDDISWVNAGDERNGTADKTKSRLISYFGRFNYTFDDKYILSLAYRRDGSSRFGSNSKYGGFPSASIGWIVSDENFMENIDKIDFLKIKANYGEVGNNNIGDFTFLPSLSKDNYVFNGSMVPGKSLDGLGNPNLGWEKTKSYDIGFDLELFNHRISLSYDYYNKKTEGLLYDVDIPSNAGFRSYTTNIGRFDFWGHEINLNTVNLDGDFKWNTNINISFDRNKVKKLGLTNAPIGGTNLDWDDNRTAVGHSIGEFYGFIYDGVYMTQEEFDEQPHASGDEVGTTRYKDVNGDGKINNDDRTWIGDPNPDAVYGITNEFSYKDFDLSVVMAGTIGNDIANDNLSSTENLDGVFNVRKEVADRWRSEDNPGKGIVPRTKTGTTEPFRNFTSRHVSKGTFLSVKNITFGYTLPIGQDFFKEARVYFSGQNLFIWSKYDGMNPEVSMDGLDGLSLGRDFSSYPISRTYSLGVNFKF